ncbi:16S rRNA (guanine1207-N2)-methyltransferase [Mesorhizobium sp. J18]|uniref:class I SAM-dependent methyltransferase n=1 Tax=Mesorhizobium sp. J18 TaxID=935263 RepID=UPI00119942E4|nr:class I SAM-dependent methyltransferase [Mesorhizobium sp. J18]TWG92383.1 16S rRNA (guanine1207-N2)-methyltransferase [Mesorhizobium sp. J18]
MTEGYARTLFYPFEAGMLPLPEPAERALVFNPPPGFRPPPGFVADLALVQDFRPYFLDLERAGYRVAPEAGGDGYDLVLVLCGRHRGQNERWIGDALRRVKAGGRVLVAGGKTEGIASLRKRLGALLEIEGHASKHHGVVIWLQRQEGPIDLSVPKTADTGLVGGAYETAPGMFSHDRIDPGSRLLLENLPLDIAGHVADFGAGWGYLSAEAAARFTGIKAIDLYEAHYASLEAARRNVAARHPDLPARYFWHDLLAEPLSERYDAIVMNPPFHQGRAAAPDIGKNFIKAAAGALSRGGRLFLVANSGLPYEETLAASFSAYGETVRNAGFKILWGRK